MANHLKIIMNEWDKVSTNEPELCESMPGCKFCILGGVVETLMWIALVLGFLLWFRVGVWSLVGFVVLELMLFIVRWRIKAHIWGCLIIVEARRMAKQGGRGDWKWGLSRKTFSKAYDNLKVRLFT